MDKADFGLESRLGEHSESIEVIAAGVYFHVKFFEELLVDAGRDSGGHGDAAAASRDEAKLAQRRAQIGDSDGSRCECHIGHIFVQADRRPVVFPAHMQGANSSGRYIAHAFRVSNAVDLHVFGHFLQHSFAEVGRNGRMPALCYGDGERSRSAAHIEYGFSRFHFGEFEESFGVKVFGIAAVVSRGLFVPSLAAVGGLRCFLVVLPGCIEIEHAPSFLRHYFRMRT